MQINKWWMSSKVEDSNREGGQTKGCEGLEITDQTTNSRTAGSKKAEIISQNPMIVLKIRILKY